MPKSTNDEPMEKYVIGDRWVGQDIQDGELKIIIEELLSVGNKHRMAETSFLSVVCVLPGLFVQDPPEMAAPVLAMLDRTRQLVKERLDPVSRPRGD